MQEQAKQAFETLYGTFQECTTYEQRLQWLIQISAFMMGWDARERYATEAHASAEPERHGANTPVDVSPVGQ